MGDYIWIFEKWGDWMGKNKLKIVFILQRYINEK